MKAVIQRVFKSSVSVDGEIISSIQKGLLVFIGISRNDRQDDIEYIVRKILNTRMFNDENGKRWMKSVIDLNYEILCVSQFTLYHSLKGNKLDFHNAMKTEDSFKFYETFLQQLKDKYHPDLVKDGKFGALMEVNICNDGPVTITIESPGRTNVNDTENVDDK